MYKVVIIDDEEIIVKGLSKMIHWDQYSCEVCGTASNGVEGIELIKRENPAIVITDICMPQMDGLSLAAALKTEYPNLQITILTGYRDFEYAREALHLGVTRLLVKPSKMAEIVEAIETMCDNLKKAGIMPDMDMPKLSEVDEDEKSDLSLSTSADEDDSARSFVVKKALEYMKENYDKHLRLEDVADNVYVSQWHLSKLLNKHTGQNFSEVLNLIRVDKSKELLDDPEFRIGEIADKVGFMDMAHFSRVFKKYTGQSPSDYRNNKNKIKQD